ncbi:MAG: ribokinase [Corynebacterium casei]|uniref:ribokinase n=1 Tax=Corynebacterium casei TaxID=160386 RepID=UPI0026483F56|nr:ribokinase [Corynebacterium casei]MDN6694559.1 ribokinase [Corynebacterium casei]
MGTLTVVGSINADLTARVQRHPNPGETLLGSGGGITAGGKGANQAVAAAYLGANVKFVGAVGQDPYVEPALKHLKESGVDLSAVAEVDDTTGLAIITVSDDGENTIVVIPGANAHVDSDFVASRRESVATADIVLLQGEILADGFAAAVQDATGRVIINLAPVVEVDKQALLAADPLLANEHEAGLILEQLGQKAASDAPKDLAQALIDAGFNSVVLTLGAQGALVAADKELIDIPTPKVTAVDTTGAGDAFAGALCARLLEGDDLVQAASFAAHVGATSTLQNGAQASYPQPSDVLGEVTDA